MTNKCGRPLKYVTLERFKPFEERVLTFLDNHFPSLQKKVYYLLGLMVAILVILAGIISFVGLILVRIW